MMQELLDGFHYLIGYDQKIEQITILQMITRTVIVYGVALLIIRLSKRRFMGNYSAFDILMGFVIGSILSRIITGRENFYSGFIAIGTLMIIHFVLAYLTTHFDFMKNWLKNEERKLVEEGEIDEGAMKKSKLEENDLLQAMRQKGNVESLDAVKSAYLERDGSITVIPRKTRSHTMEVAVEEGVQTVKIVLEG